MLKLSPKRLAILYPTLLFALLPAASGQTVGPSSNSVAPAQTPRYLPQVGLPSQASSFRTALPGAFDQVGHERRTLSGTVTIGDASAPFALVRELDQKVRLDLGTPPRTVVTIGLNTLQGTQSGSLNAPPQDRDQDILEVLANDSAEAFLFSFGTGAQLRWLGGAYTAEDLNTGTSYDVFAQTSPARGGAAASGQVKVFLFDSATKLLSFTRYQSQRNGSTIDVTIAFSGWTLLSGQMVPTSIVRSENGQPVFTISITAASSSATQADALFTF